MQVRMGKGTGGNVRRAGLAAAAVGLVATGMTVGGVAGATSRSHAAVKTTITWWASPISTSGPDLRKALITAFEKANPSIAVKLQTAPTNTDTNRASLVTTISGGASSPDVFMGDVIWPAEFGAHQLAVPLSDHLPKSYFAGFAPGLVAGATYKGKVYGAPFFEDQGFLYYRKDLLAAAHLPVPHTWQQLKTEAVHLVKLHKVKYGFVWEGASYEGGTCNFMEYLADAGGKVLNSSGTAAAINTPATVTALSFMRSLITSGASPAAVTTFQEPQAMNAFQNGQAAFLRNWDYAYSSSQAAGSKVIGKVGVEPLPAFSASAYPGYSNIGGWNLYINPHSKNMAADLTFIKFMTGTVAQTIEATKFSEIPTLESVRKLPAVKKVNPVLAIVGETRLVPRPAQTPSYPKVSQSIYSNVNSVLAGSMGARAAAAAMQSQIGAALKGTGL